MASRFGGFTDVRATGGFILRDGKIVKEKVVKVTSFATKNAFKKNEQQVIKQIGLWSKKWKQQSVSYQNEGDLFIISPSKKVRKVKKRIGKVKVRAISRKRKK